MTELLWVIKSELASLLGHQGVSGDYVIPRDQMNGAEGRLAGSRLWIVLRGEEDRCVASIAIRQVEIIDDGYYKNDFLVTCDLLKSFRLSSSFSRASRFTVGEFRSFPIGINVLDRNQSETLQKAVLEEVQVRLTRPMEVIFERLKVIDLPKTPRAIARTATSMILRNFAFDDVWAYGFGNRNSPFAFFTKCLLEYQGIDSSSLTDFLVAIDPVAELFSRCNYSDSGTHGFKSDNVYAHVDLSFSEIDPEKIVVRRFVVQEGDRSDASESLAKTEAAEKAHQDMLKDISLFLKSRGIVPFETASLDLVYWVDGKTFFCEVKSATPGNIIAQAAKGAFQIACYSNAMKDDYAKVYPALILEKIEDKALESHVQHALEYLGVRCLFYDRVVDWPYRVEGLLNGS
jgi:hypothetical protein